MLKDVALGGFRRDPGQKFSSDVKAPVIDRRYRLSEVAEAPRYLEKGHARGEVVIAV